MNSGIQNKPFFKKNKKIKLIINCDLQIGMWQRSNIQQYKGPKIEGLRSKDPRLKGSRLKDPRLKDTKIKDPRSKDPRTKIQRTKI